MDRACTKALAPGERARLVRLLEEQGIARSGRGSRWLDRVAERTLEADRTAIFELIEVFSVASSTPRAAV
jgi:hypothetical protein